MDSEVEVVPANNVRFDDLCKVLQKLFMKKKRRDEQDQILGNFIDEFKLNASKTAGKKNTSVYPILRLLLPSLDRERGAYNLKEAKLSNALVKALSPSKQSRDAQKLLNYRSVSNSQDSDFAGVAYSVLKSRLRDTSDEFSLGDIHDVLDNIASGNAAEILDIEFGRVLNDLSGEQLKWFLRIILKDLKLSMGSDRILALFHADAPEYYKTVQDLAKVCDNLDEGNTRPSDLGIEVMSAVSPMLSEKFNVKNQLPSNKTFQIEDKFDGERFQMHMDNGVFEYFSRKGHPCSKTYGKSYDEGLLTPYLKDAFGPDVQDFILDGEMMGWHKERQCFGSKGMSYDIKKITENSKFRPCFCAFDILYYNGKALAGLPEDGGLPLKERLKILDTVFFDTPGVILHSKRRIVKTSADVLGALNKAIENQDEGIVVKDVDSYYVVNRRNAGWYKIKPEYTEGAMTDLDLVIIGADEAENKRQGRAKSFLVACADKHSPDEDPERWVCVGRVASGLTFDEREHLCSTLERHWTPIKRASPPPSLVFNKEKPDFWIMPQHSVALTVRASELIRSSSFGASYTLRFPRVVRVRPDKPVRDVMTLHELELLVADKGAVVKLSTHQIDQENPDKVKVPRKRTAQQPQVAEQFLIKPSSDVEATSKALLGRKLCILSADEDCSTQDLANIIKTHSGEIDANPGSETWCCIAGRKIERVRRVINSRSFDVASTTWLRSLNPSSAPAPLHPLEMLAIKKSTQLSMARDYDQFGDGYVEPTDEAKLRRCFEKMDTEQPVEVYLTHQEMLNIDKELFGEINPHSFLRRYRIYCGDPRSITAILAKMYGAIILGSPNDRCTHIVLPKSGTDEVSAMKTQNEKALVVSEDWLETCVSKKEIVEESAFLL